MEDVCDAPPQWNTELETIARGVMDQANAYSWMYERMVSKAKRLGNFLSILSGVLAGASGTGGLVSSITSGQWTGIIIAIIGYAIAVVVILENTWKLGVVRSEALVAQVGFANLSRSIAYQLALPVSERQEVGGFMRDIQGSIETIKLSSPTIDEGVRKEHRSI